MSDNISITRDYTDSFSMKEFAFNTLAHKYYPDINISDLNIGLTGLTTELIANCTEDAFRTSSALINEAYPNRAQIPENIYAHAAIFQLDSNFATCAKSQFIIAISEDDVLMYAEQNGGYLQFYIDADTQVSVAGKVFTLDYDIQIKAQLIQGEYVYSAQYDITHNNSISDITNRYIRIKKTANRYLNLIVVMHQCVRSYRYENIINNSKINYSVIDVPFSNQLAGFDVFYTEPGSEVSTQLAKRMMYTTPIKTPFCYYKFKDANILTNRPNTYTLSFSTKDAYFQPEFNSDLKIVSYVTTGSEGNYSVYTGNDIVVTPCGDKYEYNSKCVMMAISVGSSINGADAITLDDLRELTIENYSTATVLSTESDLRYYFNNYAKQYGNDILFIKKRDDIVERLFSSFLVMKNNDYIYPTNTLNIETTTNNVDYANEDLTEMIIKPGHIFTYANDSSDTVNILNDVMVYDNDVDVDGDFGFVNPFIIKISRKPNVVGFYMNIANAEYVLDFGNANSDSFIQFIQSKIQIVRTLDGENKFTLSTIVTPTISDGTSTMVENMGATNNNLRIVLAIMDGQETTGYIEMLPVSCENDIYKFSVDLTTDDYITSTNKFKCLNANTLIPGRDYVYIPNSDCVIKAFILYRNPALYSGSPLFGLSEYQDYITTNIYSTETHPVTFIRSMGMMRSTVAFSRESSTDPFTMSLSSIPFIKWDIINDADKFNYFISSLTNQYEALGMILDRLENSTHIDIKFYNTYGKSKNFYVGDDSVIIDKVNLSIKFKIKLTGETDASDTIRDLKIVIKNYIETLNSEGVNELYISNLIHKIETEIAEIHHCRFLGINDYTSDCQTITSMVTDINELSKEDRRKYVPEMLVVNPDDIIVTTYD